LEAADEPSNFSEIEYRYGLTEDEYEKLTDMEKAVLRFNWYVERIMPYYKAEVMSVHNVSSEEYDRRTLQADESIYLPQSNRKFEPTLYDQRVAAVLGSDWQTLHDMISREEIKDRIATGGCLGWCDGDPNAVF
jgi:hypothetical protein